MHLTRDALARMIDHTLLKPETTGADVDELIGQARTLEVLAVCVAVHARGCRCHRGRGRGGGHGDRCGGSAVVSSPGRYCGGRLGVKASGGIRTARQALAMVEAGATRLGVSAAAQIVTGLDAT